MTDRSIRIAAAETAAELEAVKALFVAYAESLDFDLGFQDFDTELDGLPGKYAPPTGVLLLARLNDAPVGTVALRDLGDGFCEMKRLYVRPEGRGHGLGRRLVEQLLADARKLGYHAIRLDTAVGHHDEAIALYHACGFYEIEPYCHNPLDRVLFMERAL